MNNEKLVSVIIPTYNRAQTILKSIKSVLNQTYKNLEIIVVDDGSTDSTRQIILNLDDSRVRYIYQNNQGACVARNMGIAQSKGEYIAFQDSDDIWHSDKLKIQIDIFEKYNVDVVFCKLNRFEDGQIVEIIPAKAAKGLQNPINSLFGIGTQSLVFRREVFSVVQFDAEMQRFQDFELLLNAVEHGYLIYCVDDGLVDYYVGNDSISRNTERLFSACQRILKKYPDFCDKYPEMKKTIANTVFSVAAELHECKDESYKKYLKLSLSYSKSVKNIIKAICLRIGIYKYLRSSV